MPVRPTLLHRLASFLFCCFVKIWATCENFLGKYFTAPPAKNCPYAYDGLDVPCEDHFEGDNFSCNWLKEKLVKDQIDVQC